MLTKKLHLLVKSKIVILQSYADRFWYPYAIGLLIILDSFILIVPTDGILISSTMLSPKRWKFFALIVALASSIGAFLIVKLVPIIGLEKILEFYPGIHESHTWHWTLDFFNQYGLIVVFAMGITPFFQHPVLILAALSHPPLFPLSVMIILSRIIKYLFMAYIASHAPQLLSKMWGVKDDLDEVGIDFQKIEK